MSKNEIGLFITHQPESVSRLIGKREAGTYFGAYGFSNISQ